MCRLLSIISSEPTDYRLVLREAPRSLATLSREHRDGWGIAVFDDAQETKWHVRKGIACATEDDLFHDVVDRTRGTMMIAHVRQRTVGETSIENTHPFQRGRWVFAHNGTIKDCDYVRTRTCKKRLAEVRGQTDSELFFAFLTTKLESAGLLDGAAGRIDLADRVIADATAEVKNRADFGAFNFILSDGDVTYAHRFGRTLYMLERGPHDPPNSRNPDESGDVSIHTWAQRKRAIVIASEQLTDEKWTIIENGTLLRVASSPHPAWQLLSAA